MHLCLSSLKAAINVLQAVPMLVPMRFIRLGAVLPFLETHVLPYLETHVLPYCETYAETCAGDSFGVYSDNRSQ